MMYMCVVLTFSFVFFPCRCPAGGKACNYVVILINLNSFFIQKIFPRRSKVRHRDLDVLFNQLDSSLIQNDRWLFLHRCIFLKVLRIIIFQFSSLIIVQYVRTHFWY
jgi:hypothetical protein